MEPKAWSAGFSCDAHEEPFCPVCRPSDRVFTEWQEIEALDRATARGQTNPRRSIRRGDASAHLFDASAETISWEKTGCSERSKVAWVEAGASTAALCAAWLNAGFNPLTAQPWFQVGVTNPSFAKMARRRGWAPPLFAEFAMLGIDPTEASRWVAEGFDIEMARVCNLLGLDPLAAPIHKHRLIELRRRRREIEACFHQLLAAGFSHAEATEVALAEPDALSTLAGLVNSPEGFAFWTATGLPRDAWLDVARQYPYFRHQFCEPTADPKRTARFPFQPRMRPATSPPPAARVSTASSPRLPKPRASTPSRVISQQLPTVNGATFKDWLTLGEEWIRAAKVHTVGFRPVLERWWSAGLSWAPTDTDLFSYRVSSARFAEERDRVVVLSQLITKEVFAGDVFSAPDLVVMLVPVRDIVVAWVGRDGLGMVLSFDGDKLQPRVLTGSPSWQYAAAAALAWYVDCSITLPAGTPPTLRRIPATLGGTGVQRFNRYVPTPSFHTHPRQEEARLAATAAEHHVKGHIRKLGESRTPDQQKVRSAPAAVRQNMGPHDTFVRAHARGTTEPAEQLLSRLSQYSCLSATMLAMREL